MTTRDDCTCRTDYVDQVNPACLLHAVDPGCFWHREEPIPEDFYRVCGECLHCWPTPEELMVDVATIARQVGLTAIPADPATVFSCPLCAHDF